MGVSASFLKCLLFSFGEHIATLACVANQDGNLLEKRGNAKKKKMSSGTDKFLLARLYICTTN